MRTSIYMWYGCWFYIIVCLNRDHRVLSFLYKVLLMIVHVANEGYYRRLICGLFCSKISMTSSSLASCPSVKEQAREFLVDVLSVAC